jgi:hypothetical protein
MGLGSSLRKAWKNTGDTLREATRNPRDALALATAPLTASFAYLGGLQQGGFKGGSQAMSGVTDGEWWSDPENQRMMALTAAEVAALAATAGAASGATVGGLSAAQAASLGYGPATTASLTGTTLGLGTGLAAGGAAATSALALQSDSLSGGGNGQSSLPPDMAAAYANDPNEVAQFKRLRKAASMLGRAGTFKNKGLATSLGGEGALGSELSLTGV